MDSTAQENEVKWVILRFQGGMKSAPALMQYLQGKWCEVGSLVIDVPESETDQISYSYLEEPPS